MLERERMERAELAASADYDEVVKRFSSLYRDMGVGEEIRARISLLPVRGKMAEVEARTEKIKAQVGLVEVQKKLAEQKTEKIALENEEKRAMIALYQAAQQAVERLGNGQMIEADFEVIDQLKQMGVKIPQKVKARAFIPKQTVRA